MSESAEPRDLEDVLASIRRLVAEEVDAAVVPETAPVRAPDRLVLTPALRVAPPQPAQADSADAPDTPDEAKEDQDCPPSDADADDATDAPKAPAEDAALDAVDEDMSGAEAARDQAGDSPFDFHSIRVAVGAEKDAAPEDGAAEPDVDESDADELGSEWPDYPGVSGAIEETALLDEDMLREIVGEIVRQELQGALGERITRNVRKLVRREINRALAARNIG
ncbi:hypothetical protein [Rhodovulum adriaticum]|uniref:Uncharacterized protein n=1 Tax=Rhodovulum adriaticum TaxID=35804 RepID=A0A4R2NWL7_RHOAD|nr:hypothetical protein [Rhodovulum adriaticum]MBK1635247.1 hypothetical protein [Rhodovulum adriaticum]TCP26382.1 hypothetical protein EV656_102347 [Rhodovulum adriaticum]